LIDDPNATVAQLLKSIKGPDFPTGGEVLTKREELRALYETGRGSFKLRGNYKVEDGVRGARSLVITEIPYGTTLDQILASIADIIRQKKVPHATDVRDETTQDDGVRIVVELSKDANPEELAAYFFKHTPLQVNYGFNMTCLVPTDNPLVGRPVVLDLKGALRQFLDFRFSVVTKSLEYRRARLEERIHILEGFAKIYDDVEQALRTPYSNSSYISWLAWKYLPFKRNSLKSGLRWLAFKSYSKAKGPAGT
jgi:DNA gyrase subunit A